MKIKKICIVGYGSHVKKTIIPSLSLSSKNIKIISKKKINNFESYSSIEEAIKKLSKDYTFFNSTPPKFHYSSSKLILSSGFNIIIEKPLCLNIHQLKTLSEIAKKKNLFMFENMMYFHSKQFKLLKNLLNKKDIKEIDVKFSIPNFSRNSFRKNNSLESSILYDMGCYPFSLFSSFKLSNKNFNVSYKIKNEKINFIQIFFISRKIKIKVTLAVYNKYENYVKVIFKNNSFYKLNHFFYGKKLKKINYFYSANKKLKTFSVDEENLFKKILKFSNQKLLKLSKSQYFVIKNYLISLNQIKKNIKL